MNIWEQLLREYDSGWISGPTLSMAPDASGFRGQGARKNFVPNEFDNAEGEWPYENDDEMHYGQAVGPQGLDRTSNAGADVHGGPLVPKFQDTWEGGPGNEEDSEDKQGLEGKFDDKGEEEGEEEVDEAMGTPYNFGQGMKGGGGMGGVTPGTGGSFAHSNATFQYPDEDEAPSPPKLSDCFDPAPIDPEMPQNPDQDYLNDSTDEDLENRIETAYGAVEDEPETDEMDTFDPHVDMEAGTELNVSGDPFEKLLGMSTPGGDFMMTSDKAGQARGLYGMQPGTDQGGLFPKRSAWEEVELALDGMQVRVKK